MNTRFEQAMLLFDDYNNHDPKTTRVGDKEIPDNLLYAQRMSSTLMELHPDASEHLQLAARCQHIGRWAIPREDYPMDRKGYLQWRSHLKMHHANIASTILSNVGYDENTIARIRDLLLKKQLKLDPEMQILEDVICLVFLKYYFNDFAQKHDEEKLLSILKKTMTKMSKNGVETATLLPFSQTTKSLILKAIA